MKSKKGRGYFDPFLENALRYRKEKTPARLYGDELWFNGQTINLGPRRQLLGIIRALYLAQNKPLTLQQLMINLGDIKDFNSCSDRFLLTYRQKILKSLQRARVFLRENFQDIGLNLDWIPYDAKQGTWQFYGVVATEDYPKLKK